MAKRKKRKRSRVHHIIGGDPDPRCPICVGLAERGVLDWIEVSVCGDATAWPHLPDEPGKLMLPRRSSVGTIAEMIFEMCPALSDAALVARVNGDFSSSDRQLEDGDKITFGIASAGQRAHA